MYIDTCGHVAWQIKHKTKHQNNHTKGETQIPQPDMRFAIQQRSKKRGKSWKNHQNDKKYGNSDDTQISRPDLRFASRENSETTQNGAGATPDKKPHNPWRLSPTRSDKAHRVNTHKRIKGLWPKTN